MANGTGRLNEIIPDPSPTVNVPGAVSIGGSEIEAQPT